jgi:hypothetical protein
MSPEQALGQPTTPASDVFSLATNLAHALTGQLPFHDDNFMTVLMHIISGPAPSVPVHTDGLARVLARAFARPIAERYPDPAAFANELYACVPDAGDYDAVTSDRLAAWWPTAPQANGENHAFAGDRCTRAWSSLVPIGKRDDVRHCDHCDQPVVRVHSLAAAIPLVGNRCIAYRGG